MMHLSMFLRWKKPDKTPSFSIMSSPSRKLLSFWMFLGFFSWFWGGEIIECWWGEVGSLNWLRDSFSSLRGQTSDSVLRQLTKKLWFYFGQGSQGFSVKSPFSAFILQTQLLWSVPAALFCPVETAWLDFVSGMKKTGGLTLDTHKKSLLGQKKKVSVTGWIMPHLYEVHAWILETCECFTLYGKRDFVHVIELRLWYKEVLLMVWMNAYHNLRGDNGSEN